MARTLNQAAAPEDAGATTGTTQPDRSAAISIAVKIDLAEAIMSNH